ncbi:uncharacterized protein LOC102482434 [Tupaia chinensis]|uniref:uncharacterized protein LOC102482434 n=1 Tax=Tupaia chinensis TaxID=246437 RepID=UPI0003C90689|nr:uncharacterized protein LOC102482434 [Tupaia chinensis]
MSFVSRNPHSSFKMQLQCHLYCEDLVKFFSDEINQILSHGDPEPASQASDLEMTGDHTRFLATFLVAPTAAAAPSKNRVKHWITPSVCDLAAEVLVSPTQTHFTAFAESPHINTIQQTRGVLGLLPEMPKALASRNLTFASSFFLSLHRPHQTLNLCFVDSFSSQFSSYTNLCKFSLRQVAFSTQPQSMNLLFNPNPIECCRKEKRKHLTPKWPTP